MVGLNDPLRRVLGRTAERLESGLQLRTVRDLLHHYPRRYYRRGELTDLAELVVGEHVTIMARIDSVKTVPFRNRSTGRMGQRTVMTATDGSGSIQLTFFNQRWLGPQLEGRIGMFSGQVRMFNGRRELVHPERLLVRGGEDPDDLLSWAGNIIPVYPAAKGANTEVVAKAVEALLPFVGTFPDPLPEEVRRRHGLVDLATALSKVHRPQTQDEADVAKTRLRFEEAFVLQTALLRRRKQTEQLLFAIRPGMIGGLLDGFDARLHYDLTVGQRQVGGAIADDLARPRPMHRLLQGDVGTGKTLVALRAMLQVVDSGGQCVLMAPTEVLAQQHYTSIVQLLGPLAEGGLLGGEDEGTRVTLLTGSTSGKARRQALGEIASGEAGIVVGTHALLQGSVTYHDLGLIVVDEQHRFGVEQRSTLLDRIPGQRPHVLVMTATPIPRTVAMTVFGDLDVSTLTERPLGEPRVVTHVFSESGQPAHMRRAWQRVAEEVAAGRQVFVVCARIDETDEDVPVADDPTDVLFELGPEKPHALTTLVEQLKDGPLAGVRMGMLHGRMTAEEKTDAMQRFALGPGHERGIGVLVSTSVIEVGIDVPDASMMVIMDAERFGVSQLHQLRGRIGRAGQESVCLLVTQTPIGSPTYERLEQVAKTNDGFELARLDLELRREGDVLGAVQSGSRSSLRLLSVLNDEAVIASAREEVVAVMADDPDLAAHAGLADAVAAFEAGEQADYLERA